MHQPLYKDRLTGQYLMPWVRLHALKDYLDMLAVLEPYPTLHQTFNLVPSLLEQLVDYAEHEAWDRALELLVKPVDALTPDDRHYVLERFFDLNWAHMLRPYPRYAELLEKRERVRAETTDVPPFTDADWLDLTTWFNLAWFDPHWLKTDPALAALVAKGRGFSQADRELLLAKNREYVNRVIPAYREAAKRGQVELTTTPYYHPILPLLCDSESARVARPHLPLPTTRFRQVGDAETQIARGIEYFERQFGHSPKGMWPSEQSVSPEVLGLLADRGLHWAISDEGVLAHSLGLQFRRDPRGIPYEAIALYQPYRVDTPNGPVSMVFRDIVLSDLIGFSYAQQAPEAAAADLHGRLNTIRKLLPDGEDYLVTIALDGENCWEHYMEDGAPFLHAFYKLFEADPALEMVTVAEYLEKHPPRRSIAQIHAGSWIASDFTTWIGDPTKNRAWDALSAAREALVAAEDRIAGTEAHAKAWEEIYIAEGSDWFWWFGEGHDSGQDELFDWQFRLHLQNVYTLIGEEPPETLSRSLSAPARASLAAPRAHVSPTIDGELGAAEWDHAGVFDPTLGQGAMHAAAKLVQRLRYLYDAEHLYLAVEFATSYAPAPGDSLVLFLCYPGLPRLNSPIPFVASEAVGATAGYQFAHALHLEWGERVRAELQEAGEYGSWVTLGEVPGVAYRNALEVALPLGALRQSAGQEVQFVVAALREGQLVEVLPESECLTFLLPELEVHA
jgi:alpha-amylase/alpha-mannosidase (GH57 family)